MKKDVRYTLIDTQQDFSYEDYKEFCEVNGLEVHEMNSDDYWDYVYEMRSLYYNDRMDDIKFSKENDPVVVTGTLGLWNGRKSIYPVRCESLHEAIEKCIGSSVVAKVTFENGFIYVNVYHHDGTNYFVVSKLSKKGLKFTDNWNGPCTSRINIRRDWVKLFKII